MMNQNPAPSDRAYAEIRARISRTEDEITSLMLARDLSDKTRELSVMPGWKIVCDRLRSIADRQVARLSQEEPQPYWVGRAQGYIRAISVIVNLRMLSPEELAEIEDRVTVLTEKVAELRNLLD